MPYISDLQRKFFNVNRKKLESQGVNVSHWNKVSKGLKLPGHASSSLNDKKKKVLKKVLSKFKK